MNIEQKKEKLVEARNKITAGIKILREVFNDSKANWCDKSWGTAMTVAMGHSVDVCTRLDESIEKIENGRN